MQINRKVISRIAFFILCGSLFLLSGNSVFSRNALLTLLASEKDPQAGETVYLQAWVDTAGESINTVHLEIRYDIASLSYLESSFTGSVVPSVVERNTETPGLIKLTGFRTTSFSGQGLVTTLKFRALQTDNGKVTLLPSSTIHLADGNGTNAYNETIAPVVNFPTDQFTTFDPATIPGLASEPNSPLLGQEATPPDNLFPEREVEDYTDAAPNQIEKSTREIAEIIETQPESWLPVVIFGTLALVGLVSAVILLIKKKKDAQT